MGESPTLTDLIIIHLESEPTHSHWSGRGCQLASRCPDWLVTGGRFQDLHSQIYDSQTIHLDRLHVHYCRELTL